MNTKSYWIDEFRHRLNEMSHEHERDAVRLGSEGDVTAAVLAKIRRNVVDIFIRMLEVCAREPVQAMTPALRKIVSEHPVREARERAMFEYYLRMIPGSWEQALEEAIRFEDREAEMKERCKLDVRDRILAGYRETVGPETGRRLG